MTLIVSLRVPDGVVLAADSLQTSQITIGLGIPIKDPKTGKDIPFPSLSMPSSTSSFAQKLFPFKDKFGVATFGSAILNNRTIYNHIKNLEISLKSVEIDSVSKAGKFLLEYFDGQLQQQLKATNQILKEKEVIMGLQVVGFESETDLLGHTVDISIGKTCTTKLIDGIGCTVSGDSEVVSKIWEIGRGSHKQTNYASFSLKDAIDYAEFLINTTAGFQRFANMIPTVGGEVDIALITNYSKFTWIKCKELTKILEKP